MADIDSLCESDKDQNYSTVDADDETLEQGESTKRKNLKKKKQHRQTAKKMDNVVSKSSGESDGKNADEFGPADSHMTLQEENEEQLKQVQQALELIKLNQKISTNSSTIVEQAKQKSFPFWDTQPVPKLDEEVTTNEPVEPDKSASEIRQEPYTLPSGFEWDTMELSDPIQIEELYTLLTENYVEDDDAMFRFDYSMDFLRWALQPPGWKNVWHCGVRVQKNRKLVGFISAVPVTMNLYSEKNKRMVDINFLCVHKKLRSKRVAPVLIREITRRVNCFGIFQAVYTAGIVLPKPISKCRYWHRSLNPRKLIDVKFSHLSRNMTMQRMLKLYKLPSETQLKGFRKTKSSDINSICDSLNTYLSKFELAPVFTLEEAEHWFTPRKGIMDSYVVEDTDGKITDFISFYTLPSSVMNHPTHTHVNAAYGFYSFANSVSWTKLMYAGLIVAKQNGLDVFNALNLMDNKCFLEDLKFGIGDGDLQYYLYNWKCPTMIPEKVGLVLQ